MKMIYLFCSASRPLYKRDALECTCYPPGHLFRFRYENQYVDPAIWEEPKTFKGKEGIIVFIDIIGEEGHKDFDFLPIRKIKTVRLFAEGLALYIDFKFGNFVNYGSETDNTRRELWSRFFKKMPNRPWPPAEKSGREKGSSEGYFIASNCQDNPEFPAEGEIAHEAWANLIRRLNRTNDLKDSTFFQILGFYKVKRMWSIPIRGVTIRVPRIGVLSEVPIMVKDNSYESFYSLPMGKSVVLKLLFSRPSYADTEQSRHALRLKAGRESFIGASKNVIYSESRYNEERIVLVCKRVFDSVMSTVSIEQKDEPASIQAPKPFLLTRIKVPRYIIGIVILGVLLSTFFVGLDLDSVKVIGIWILPTHAKIFEQHAKVFLSIGKLIAPIPIAISAYLAFRRLPLK